VSDRGDDRGDDLQPADPWEIGIEPAAEEGAAGEQRSRRRRGRGASDVGAETDPAPVDEVAVEEDVDAPVVSADDVGAERDDVADASVEPGEEVRPGSVDEPAVEEDSGVVAADEGRVPVGAVSADEVGAEQDDVADASVEPGEEVRPGSVDQPASQDDVARGDDEPATVVDSPAWAGDITRGAEHVEAEGFDAVVAGGEEVEDREPAAGDLPVSADDGPEAVGGADLEEPADDEIDGWSTSMAERSPYGVPTREAFDALAGDENLDETMGDWESFVGGPPEDVPAASDVTEPASEEMTAETEPAEEEPPRRLSWRERRRLRKAEKAARSEQWASMDDVAGYPGPDDADAEPWVEGGPEETEWLQASDDGGEEPAVDDPVAAPIDTVLDRELEERRWADAEAEEAPLRTGVPDASGAVDEDAAPEATPASEPDRPYDETVWLLAEQRLVDDEEPPADMSRRPGPVDEAAAPQPERWDDPVDEYDFDRDGSAFDEYEAGGWEDDRDVEVAPAAYGADEDEWVTGAVAYSRPGSPGPVDDDDEVELTEERYGASATVEHRGLAQEIDRAGVEEREWQAVSAAMPGIDTGVVGFDDVADLEAEDEDYTERARTDLGTRVVTASILVLLLLGSLWVGPEAFAAFVGLLALLALSEYYTALRLRRHRPIALFGYLGGIGLLAGAWYHGPVGIVVAIVLIAVVTFFVYAFAPLGRDAMTNGGLTLLGVVWITGTVAFAFPLIQSAGFRVLVLTVVAVTVAMDVGAYAVGRMWGSRLMAPVLSPNKTVEGLIGGVAAAAAAAFGASMLFEEIALTDAVAVAAVVAVLAPIGDLAESMIKRSLEMKDMGTILPGHGGILDRIDAFLFVLPGMWVVLEVLELIG
jgi:phosphatidate cytidylyltransferase